MKSILIAASIFLLATQMFAAASAVPAIIPAPQKMEVLPGAFQLTGDTKIMCAGGEAEAQNLAARLRSSTGFNLPVAPVSTLPGKSEITLLIQSNLMARLGAEGYELSVAQKFVTLRAPTPAGLFYGAQSLLQLLPPEIFSSNVVTTVNWQAPCVQIEDWPRFAWRGMMLDSSRHFQAKEFVERYLDEMAIHKLNLFHWHLVDDQGWRLEIKKYPKLTSVGAWRKQPGYPENNGIYGGFYTQDEIREVVAYAAARHITIVPEIEIPGHSQAAIAAYPELSCSGEPGCVGYFFSFPSPPMAKFPSNSCNVFCASNPKTLEFLEDVLTETMDLFPGKYIHIGGDEVGTNYWTHCPQCQALMKNEALNNYHELQGWLTKKVEKFLNEHDRQLIGWDEILAGGLAPNATVMSWRGIAGGIAAVKAGHPAIMAPNNVLYFNRAQSSAPDQPPAPRRVNITLESVYNYDPVPAGLTPAQENLILGAEACLWTERLNRSDWLETMTYPRLCALAEVDWSAKAARDWNQFSKRMETHLQRLAEMGVAFSHANISDPNERKVADSKQSDQHALTTGTRAADTLDFTARLAAIGPDNQFAQAGYYVWGASAIRGEDGKYYLFYARWPTGTTGRAAGDEVLFKDMKGWLKYSEIAAAVSDSPAGPFHYVATILKGTGDTNRWDCYNAHNPQIKIFGGKACLYYIANNLVTNKDRWMQHADGQRIGVAVSDSVTNLVAGKFQRSAQPLVSPDGTNTFCRAVNPSVTRGRDGLYLMMFKARSAPTGGRMTMWIASADKPDGPFHLDGPAITNPRWEAEDPCFWYDRERDRYYVIVKDYSRQQRDLSPQFGALALLTSVNGTGDWQPANHSLVSFREFTDADGRKHRLANLERPQLLFDERGKPVCLYTAAGEEDPFAGHPSFNLHFAIREGRPAGESPVK